jgi:hypothetical protein
MEADLDRNKSALPPDAFKAFKAQWDEEYSAALEAYEIEMETMRNVHALKTLGDRKNLQRKIEDLDAFKDAEAQEMPSAERLEQISRVELHFWMDEMDKKIKALELVKHEYDEVKAEVWNDLMGENKKKVAEARTMINFAEASVKARQTDLRAAIEAMNDAEVLLNRAIRIKKQQDRLMPLFQLISGETLPSSCRFDLFFAALSLLVVGTFDMKIDIVFSLLDKNKVGTLSISDMFSIVQLYSDVMFRLKLLSMPPNEEELQNIIFRAFFERGLSWADRLTRYEVKCVLRQLCSHSRPASVALGIPRADGMCTYQRNVMSPLRLVSLDMVGAAACKYRIHYESSRYRPQLEVYSL